MSNYPPPAAPRRALLFASPVRSHINNQAASAVPRDGQLRAVSELRGLSGLSELLLSTSAGDQMKSVFPFKTFNRMQSLCFDTAYHTDSNLVVSAPTGSGKTGVMELAIVRLISKPGGDRAKIIYIAPTKALCSERAKDWTKKFRVLGITCGELTGDTDSAQVRDVQQSNIIVTTPEKWDSMTRRWRDHKQLMELVQLILIDEVHFLNEPHRGAVLEVIVSRMRTVNAECLMNEQYLKSKDPQKTLRILALSATAPNINDIAVWLKNYDGKMAEVKLFGEEFRPVQLVKHVVGYTSKTDATAFIIEKTLDYKLTEIISRYSDKKPTLVFCATRKNVESSASQLVSDIQSCQIGFNHPYIRTGLQQTELRQLASRVADKKLAECLNHGIAIHNGALVSVDRTLVEENFISGLISVICTTSTLSVGVNLPAHLVVIKGTQQYRETGYAEYSELDIMQMMGRAGRPQFDNSGVVVIMTTLDKTRKYENMVSGKEIIESSLHENLIEHLNAEVVLGTIPNVELCIEWLKSTFLNVRMSKNPIRYKDPRDKQGTQHMSLDKMCIRDLNLLAQARLIEQRDDGMTVVPTDFGRVMAKYYVRFETAKNVIVDMQKAPTMKKLLESLCDAVELSGLKYRNDKTYLNSINKIIKYPINGKLKTVGDRVDLLIQCTLGSIKLTDAKLLHVIQTDTNVAFKHAERLARFIFEVMRLKQDFQAADAALELSNSIHARTWEKNGHHLKQVENIGPVYTKLLFDAGVKTVREFLSKSPEQLEIILNKGRLLGNKLLDAAKAFPLLDLNITEFKPYGGSEIEFHLTITLENPQTAKSFAKKGLLNVVCLIGNEVNNELLDYRKFSIKEIQTGQKFMLKFKKCSGISKLKFIAAVDEYVGLTVVKFATVEGIGMPNHRQVAPNTAVAPIFRQTAPSNAPIAHRAASPDVFALDGDDEFDFGDEDLQMLDSIVSAATAKPVVELIDLTSAKVKPSGSIRHVAPSVALKDGRVSCRHACANKELCEHLCCKHGAKPSKKPSTVKNSKQKSVPSAAPTFVDDNSDSDFDSTIRVKKSKPRIILPLSTVLSSDSDTEFKSCEEVMGVSRIAMQPSSTEAAQEIGVNEHEKLNETVAVEDECEDFGDTYDEWGDYVADEHLQHEEGQESSPPLFSDSNSSPEKPELRPTLREVANQKVASSTSTTLEELNLLHLKTASSNAGTKPWLFSRPTPETINSKRPASPSPAGFDQDRAPKRQQLKARALNTVQASSYPDILSPSGLGIRSSTFPTPTSISRSPIITPFSFVQRPATLNYESEPQATTKPHNTVQISKQTPVQKIPSPQHQDSRSFFQNLTSSMDLSSFIATAVVSDQFIKPELQPTQEQTILGSTFTSFLDGSSSNSTSHVPIPNSAIITATKTEVKDAMDIFKDLF